MRAFRLVVAAPIAVTAACLYSVPDVLPGEPDGSAPRLDGGARDVTPTAKDAGDADTGTGPAASTILEGAGVVTAFLLDESGKRALLGIKNGATHTLVEFDPTATAVQTQTLANTSAPITSIAGQTGSSIVFQAGNEMFRVAPPAAPQPILLASDAAAFTFVALVPGIDSSAGTVFVVGTDGVTPELRSVAVATGVTDPLATVAEGSVGHRFIDALSALYWFEPAGTLAALARVSVSNKLVTKSSARYFPVLGVRKDTPIVATTSAFLRLSGTSVVSGATIGSHSGTPTVLGAADDSISGAPYWVQDPPNVVRYATSTTASAALAPITIDGSAAPIAFLAGLGSQIFIVANATDRYLVARY